MNFSKTWIRVLRWILFIPTFFLTYTLLNILTYFLFNHFFGYPNVNIICQIIYIFQRDLINFAVCIYFSCMCAPKFKVGIGLIYLGIILLTIGVGLVYHLLSNGFTGLVEYAFTCLVCFHGGLFGLALVMENHNKLKRQNIHI